MKTKQNQKSVGMSAASQLQAAKRIVEAINRSQKASFIKYADKVLFNNYF